MISMISISFDFPLMKQFFGFGLPSAKSRNGYGERISVASPHFLPLFASIGAMIGFILLFFSRIDWVRHIPDLCLLKNGESNGAIGFPIFSSLTENLSLFRRCLFSCQKACFEGSDGITLKLHRRWLFNYLGRVCFSNVLLDMNTYCELCLFIIRMGGLYLGIFSLYIYVTYITCLIVVLLVV